MARVLEKYQEIERSIIKRFRKDIWNKFVMGIKEYDMIADGDEIAALLTGSAYSYAMALCMAHLASYSETKFNASYIALAENESTAESISDSCRLMHIPLADRVFIDSGKSYEENILQCAEKCGCTKAAVCDNFDNVIEDILASMLYKGRIESILPIFTLNENIRLIRPMYMVKAEHISQWENYNSLSFPEEPDFLQSGENQISREARQKSRELIARFRKTNPFIETNIFKSVYNVKLSTLVGFEKDGEHHSFLEYFLEDRG